LDIECVIVSGYARGYGSSLFGAENPHSSNHAWNKVKIDGNWYLIDTTWDSGYVSGQNFTAQYKTDYLFPDPLHFLHDHFPLSPDDQLLPTPLTAEEFVKLPMVKPGFFFVIEGFSPNLQKITDVNGQFLRIDFTPRQGYHFMFDLKIGGTNYNRFFSQQRRDGKISLTFHFQRPGTYMLRLYTSTKATGRHDGIGDLGFNVVIPAMDEGELPGGARILFPEGRELAKNNRDESTEFTVMPGKWKYIALIRGGNWQYLTPDEKGAYSRSVNISTGGTCYLAASETECGVYETLAVFNVKP
jgi:hypothetical protein